MARDHWRPRLRPRVLTVAALLLFHGHSFSSMVAEVRVVDRDYLMVHVLDGEVIHKDDGLGSHAFEAHSHMTGQDTVKRHDPPLDTAAVALPESWTVASSEDADYSGGKHPAACYRKSKVNGHAEKEWIGSDYRYEYTREHFIYLHLPAPLEQGVSYTLTVDGSTNAGNPTHTFTFDIRHSRTEALHVNLVGYHPRVAAKAADLYTWMGDGGARDYSNFDGNQVYLYDVAADTSYSVGTVAFHAAAGSDVGWYDLTRSAVWKADFGEFTTPGTYRLAVEGVGCSPDFDIRDDIYFEPFRVSVLGFFYMRIGQDSTGGIRPVPRRPLYIPQVDPADTKVYLTDMHPWHDEWQSFSSGDVWDKPDDWKRFVKSGNPTNPHAWGGHSDALDWDRHLGHVSIIYDLLLPFVLTDGAIDNDDLGIAESGNGIPDILDEARNEVDFWLRLRDGAGYAHGLTNPNKSNELFQAAPTAIAAWANAANAAMLADCLRRAGLQELTAQYRDSAVAAYTHATGLADGLLDEKLNIGESWIRGRDLKMTAAAFLYNVTGDTAYERAVSEESVCTGPEAVLDDYGAGNSRNQVWAVAAYLSTPHTVHYPELAANMRASVIHQAKSKEAGLCTQRPSRRATDVNTGYFRTIQNVHRTLIAHAVTDDADDKALFRTALVLEADYGLGRNPLNMIQMTTATTALADKRSVTGAYTSGRNDGSPGLHPGHTPYMNLDDWYCGMTMGCPSRLHGKSYPADFKNSWPIGEGYFNTRYVWAHTEFTPQQTMRGKMALYGYLYGLGARRSGAPIRGFGRHEPKADNFGRIRLTNRRIFVPVKGTYEITMTDLAGRVVRVEHRRLGPAGQRLRNMPECAALRIVRVRGMGGEGAFALPGL